MPFTLEHIETLSRIQKLKDGDQLVSDPKIIQDLAAVDFIRTREGAVAITLDGSLWLAEHHHRLATLAV